MPYCCGTAASRIPVNVCPIIPEMDKQARSERHHRWSDKNARSGFPKSLDGQLSKRERLSAHLCHCILTPRENAAFPLLRDFSRPL